MNQNNRRPLLQCSPRAALGTRHRAGSSCRAFLACGLGKRMFRSAGSRILYRAPRPARPQATTAEAVAFPVEDDWERLAVADGHQASMPLSRSNRICPSTPTHRVSARTGSDSQERPGGPRAFAAVAQRQLNIFEVTCRYFHRTRSGWRHACLAESGVVEHRAGSSTYGRTESHERRFTAGPAIGAYRPPADGGPGGWRVDRRRNHRVSVVPRPTSAIRSGKNTEISAVSALLLAGLLYQTLFLALAEATPGMKCAGISLCTFDGQSPTRAQSRRVGRAAPVCASAGLGVAWASSTTITCAGTIACQRLTCARLKACPRPFDEVPCSAKERCGASSAAWRKNAVTLWAQRQALH